MGNLEKAGVLVVVALLAVILVVAFLNFPDQPKTPMLGAAIGKQAQADGKKPAKPKADLPGVPDGPEVIRPKPDNDRPSTDAAPRLVNDPMGPVNALPPPSRKEDVVITPTPLPPTPPVADPVSHDPPKKAASGYPKVVKVQTGESLWAIAVREYGAKVGPKMLGAIADANPKVRPEAMKAGTEISLPAPPTETVAAPSAADTHPKTTGSTGAKSEKPATGGTAPAKTRKLPFIPE